MRTETIKKILDAFLLVLEARVIGNAKTEAVRRQDFEEASKWRDLEKQLESTQMPTYEELKALRDEL